MFISCALLAQIRFRWDIACRKRNTICLLKIYFRKRWKTASLNKYSTMFIFTVVLVLMASLFVSFFSRDIVCRILISIKWFTHSHRSSCGVFLCGWQNRLFSNGQYFSFALLLNCDGIFTGSYRNMINTVLINRKHDRYLIKTYVC